MNDNRNKLRSLLNLVKEQVEIIANQKGEVPQLYIDMAKENLIKLYEEIHLLEKLKKEIHSKEVLIPEIKEAVVALKKEAPLVEKTKVETPKVVEQAKVEVEVEVQLETEKEVTENTIEKSKQVKPETEKKTVKKIIDSNDLFESQLSIGEKLQAQQEPALVDKFQDKQIQDIKSAIGINEKFLFINELFGGNMQKYNQSIEKLDFAATKEEAAQIIGELETELKWDPESEARQKLLLFIDRRY